MACLGGGQRQQDVTLRAGAALRQIAVDAGFGALVGQVLPPAPKVGCGRLSPVGISIASVVRHPTMVGFTPGNAATFLRSRPSLPGSPAPTNQLDPSNVSPASNRPAKPLDAGNTQQNRRGGRLCSGYSYAMTCNAFVLGGGGVLGAAEVGMARALLEAGVCPDLVCGTSVGAINGAAIAADPTPDGVKRLLAIWDALADDGVLDSSLIRRVAEVMRRRTSLHGNDTLRRLLRDRLPAKTFEDLAVPFECVAASIERAREHWFSTGDLIEPILASCALPGVFPPVRIGDEHFFDGGLVNSIPLERAVARGADTVWVLHVGRLEEELAAPRFLWQVAFVAFEISRRHRFHSDLERVGAGVTVHMLPTGMPQRPAATWSNLRYRDTGRIARRAELAYDATREYLEALP